MSLLRAITAGVVLIWGCTDSEQVGGDGAEDSGAEAAHDAVAADAPSAEGAVDAEVDADAEARPGPATFVMDEHGFLADRLCDHDGDGLPDNALADLGSGPGGLLAAMWTTALQQAIRRGLRTLAHFPWIDDLAAPADDATVVIIVGGVDTEDVTEIDDDFSGEEPFYADPGDLDPCGEPEVYSEEVAIAADEDGGRIGWFHAPFPLNMCGGGTQLDRCDLPLRDSLFRGRLEPWAREGELELCGYFEIRDLVELGELPYLDGLTMLEGFVAGGGPLGQPMVPGLSPDLDLDGDGLERFELDDTFHLARCIDGDSTVIEGPDCWQDPRIADAFALVAYFHLLPAVFAGLPPHTPTSCDDPPETSLWDPR